MKVKRHTTHWEKIFANLIQYLYLEYVKNCNNSLIRQCKKNLIPILKTNLFKIHISCLTIYSLQLWEYFHKNKEVSIGLNYHQRVSHHNFLTVLYALLSIPGNINIFFLPFTISLFGIITHLSVLADALRLAHIHLLAKGHAQINGLSTSHKPATQFCFVLFCFWRGVELSSCLVIFSLVRKTLKNKQKTPKIHPYLLLDLLSI